jgi:hypothetical protein
LQGDESTADEKGASALRATELDDSLGGRPMQVRDRLILSLYISVTSLLSLSPTCPQIRVTQGKEPAHFRHLFQGSLIIHKGGKASSFKNVNASDSNDTDGVALFHVRGTQPMNTFGVQVREEDNEIPSFRHFLTALSPHPLPVGCRSGAQSELC